MRRSAHDLALTSVQNVELTLLQATYPAAPTDFHSLINIRVENCDETLASRGELHSLRRLSHLASRTIHLRADPGARCCHHPRAIQ